MCEYFHSHFADGFTWFIIVVFWRSSHPHNPSCLMSEKTWHGNTPCVIYEKHAFCLTPPHPPDNTEAEYWHSSLCYAHWSEETGCPSSKFRPLRTHMESDCSRCWSHVYIYQNIVQGHWATQPLAELVDMDAHADVVVKALLLPVWTYLGLSLFCVCKHGHVWHSVSHKYALDDGHATHDSCTHCGARLNIEHTRYTLYNVQIRHLTMYRLIKNKSFKQMLSEV